MTEDWNWKRLVGVCEEAVAGWDEDASGRKCWDEVRGLSDSIGAGRGSVRRD